MNTTSLGHEAELAAVEYIKEKGLIIVEKNWRNRWCEIDIVAAEPQKQPLRNKLTHSNFLYKALTKTNEHRLGSTYCRVHFVEVKYRRSTYQGDGIDAVEYYKQKQLKKAALHWIGEHRYDGVFQIDVVGVSGPPGLMKCRYIENAVHD